MKALHSVAAIPPQLDSERVAQTLARDFGLRGDLQPLVSERDQNFRLTTADQGRFVVKIVSSSEAQATTDFQISTLLHLEEKGLAGVPRIVRSVTGATCGVISARDGAEYLIRVASWVSGTPLQDCKLSIPLARALGASLARLDCALSDVGQCSEDPVLLWDMRRAAELLELTSHIDDEAIRKPVEQILEDFRDRVSGQLRHLPRQAIHNDANPSNVLVDSDSRDLAFIDFGDMLFAARIIELATAAAYLRSRDGNALQFIAPFVAAYHAANRISNAEFDVLYELIQTRLAMTISILYWRVSARDADDAYRQQSLQSEMNAVEFLLALKSVGREHFCSELSRALGAG